MKKSFKNKCISLYLKLKQAFFPKKKYISGYCRQCGECCKDLRLFYSGIPLTDINEFNELCATYPEYSIFKLKHKSSNGQLVFFCTNLGKDNKCSDYKNRPDICINYPKVNTQIRFKKQLKNCGFNLNNSLDFKDTLKLEMLKNK